MSKHYLWNTPSNARLPLLREPAGTSTEPGTGAGGREAARMVESMGAPSALACRVSSHRRDGRVAEGARLESVYTLTGIVGSNPTLSASIPLKSSRERSFAIGSGFRLAAQTPRRRLKFESLSLRLLKSLISSSVFVLSPQ